MVSPDDSIVSSGLRSRQPDDSQAPLTQGNLENGGHERTDDSATMRGAAFKKYLISLIIWMARNCLLS